ncbi:MAG: hypothetical protein LBE14_08660, partial [Treponema sp.]|nr:hypothetical protein [Treponema sp.]
NELMKNYRIANTTPDKPLPCFYHSLYAKIKRLSKFISFNPFEEGTHKKTSKYSLWKRERGKKPLEPLLEDTSVLERLDKEKYPANGWRRTG